MLSVLMDFGLCPVFITPEHVLRCYSFAAKYYFSPYREDLKVESETQTEGLGVRFEEGDTDVEARAHGGDDVTN